MMGLARPCAARCGACSSIPSRSAPSTGARCSRTSATSPARRGPGRARSAARLANDRPEPLRDRRRERATRGCELRVRKLDRLVRPGARLRRALRRRSARLLARQRAGPTRRARFSFMGAGGGPLARASPTTSAASEVTRRARRRRPRCGARRSSTTSSASCDSIERGPASRCRSTSTAASSATSATSSRPTAAGRSRTARHCRTRRFMFADRLIAFDHVERRTYLALPRRGRPRRAGERWLEELAARLDASAAARRADRPTPAPPPARALADRDTRATYLADIAPLQGVPHRGRDATRSA